MSAARALRAKSDLSAPEIVRTALEIAGEICVYTNLNITVLEIGNAEEPVKSEGEA